MNRLVKWCLGISVLSGTALAGTVAMPEVLPAAPDGFGGWQAVSLLAYVSIIGFLIFGGVCFMLFRAMLKQSESLLKTAEAMAAQTHELARLNTQAELTQQHLLTLNIMIKSRPCHDPVFIDYRNKLEQMGQKHVDG